MCFVSYWVRKCHSRVKCHLICSFSDPYYLAPECFTLDLAFKALVAANNSHLENEILDPANDKSCVWSFGVILLELCLVR